MPEVAFVISARQPYPLRDLATTLGAELALQDVPCTLHLGGFPEPRPSLVYVLLDPEAYVAEEGEQALPADGILRRTIFICTDPPPADTEGERVALLRKAGSVFVLGRRSVAAMHRLGIPARLITPGYARSLDRFDPAAPRPIDVLFLGAHSPRRTKYLSRAAPVLSRHNCVLALSEDIPSASDTEAPLADARWSLLTQAKVLISIQRHERSRFDWGGALDAIHAGAVVVTEPSGGMAPLLAGEHVVVGSPDSLPYLVEDLLGDEQRLARLRCAAYERLKAWSPYALSVAVLRAAIVELVGEPLPTAGALGRPRPAPEADTEMPQETPEGTSGTRSYDAVRIEVVHESPAWGSRRAPCVTAVATLQDRIDQVVATLDSLAQSRLRDFELVLVDHSDGKQNRQIVGDWMSAHPEIAARLVTADVTGVGAARNIGLGLARGAFLLILAPGQELYPRCLSELRMTLEATPPDVAFAYPIQEVTGDPAAFVNAGGDYLLSYLEWGSARIGYIHTPALIRTDSLRRLGGYATDDQAERIEDEELWRRIAAQGWRGRLVPQVLARRVESGTSPRVVTQP